jgi:hypothetical protein
MRDGALTDWMHVDRWRNRRRMAWLCVAAALAFPVLLLVLPAEVGQHLAGIAGPFYVFVGMVVATYIGAAAWDDRNVMQYQYAPARGTVRRSMAAEEWEGIP